MRKDSDFSGKTDECSVKQVTTGIPSKWKIHSSPPEQISQEKKSTWNGTFKFCNQMGRNPIRCFLESVL